MGRTGDQQRSRTGIVIRGARGENLSVHGRGDNKPSLSTVWQKYGNGSTNSLPNAAEPQVNAIFTYSPGISAPNTDSSTWDDFRDCSETPPRLLRDQCQTVGRLDPQNQA